MTAAVVVVCCVLDIPGACILMIAITFDTVQ